VDGDCEARDLGVFAGDVVVAVQGVKVTTPEQLREAVSRRMNRAAHMPPF
jgi:hypothetical protein